MIDEKKPQRKRKALFIFFLFILVFGGFFYLISIPSQKSIAVRELATCNNIPEVKTVYQKYKSALFKNEDFLTKVRTQLNSFNLPDSIVLDCQEWLPQPPTSVNLVIVPDLSNRLDHQKNNPQIERDKFILKSIWKSFEKRIGQKKNSNDYLCITVTGPEQGNGSFNRIADHLIFDISKHKNKVNRLFFTNYQLKKYTSNIDSLYLFGASKASGADYVSFVRRHLGLLLKKSTLFDHYQNKVIFLTDGYIEKKHKTYTHLNLCSKKVLENSNANELIPIITEKGLNIPAATIDLSETEVLICEVNERVKGRDCHFQLLKAYWKDWFQRMGLPSQSFQFIRRDFSLTKTCDQLDQFIQK